MTIKVYTKDGTLVQDLTQLRVPQAVHSRALRNINEGRKRK